MAEESSLTEISLYLKDTGKEISQTGQADAYLITGKYTKDSGSMVEWKVREFYSNKMELPIQGSGSIIYNTVMGTKNGPTEQNIKAALIKEPKKDMES